MDKGIAHLHSAYFCHFIVLLIIVVVVVVVIVVVIIFICEIIMTKSDLIEFHYDRVD